MKRGFKAHAEREAERVRRLVSVAFSDPLPARVLAEELEIMIVSPADIPGVDDEMLSVLRRSSSHWSAVTLPTTDPVRIIHNPFHAATRQESDLMHEIAHILCGHRSDHLVVMGGLPFRSFDKEQEEEAAWLGAALQAPREALLALFGRGMETADVARYLGCSEDLVRYRRNATGIDHQLGNRPRLEEEPQRVLTSRRSLGCSQRTDGFNTRSGFELPLPKGEQRVADKGPSLSRSTCCSRATTPSDSIIVRFARRPSCRHPHPWRSRRMGRGRQGGFDCIWAEVSRES